MRLRDLVAACLFAALTACSPPPAPTEPPFTGVWTGPLPVSATEQHTFAVVLHERADLKLIGYQLGGTSERLLQGALRSGDHVLMAFRTGEGEDGQILLSGAVSGDALTGTAFLGNDEFPVTWTRVPDALDVRTFVFATSVEGSGAPGELAVVQDSKGVLVAGGFTGGSCEFITCAAAVTSLAETPAGDITIGLAADGACPGASTITASFNAATSFYNGAWTHTDAGACGGAATTGTLIGARDLGTRSTHVASVLANPGQLADHIEDGAAFGASHAALAPSYLHFGETAAAFLAARNAEVAAHADARIELHSFTSIRTVTPTGHHPMLASTLGVTFADERRDGSGVYRSAAAGAPAAERLLLSYRTWRGMAAEWQPGRSVRSSFCVYGRRRAPDRADLARRRALALESRRLGRAFRSTDRPPRRQRQDRHDGAVRRQRRRSDRARERTRRHARDVRPDFGLGGGRRSAACGAAFRANSFARAVSPIARPTAAR